MSDKPEYSSKPEYPHSDLTERIIGAAMQVHTILGPGYQEKIYENALLRELVDRRMGVRQQVRYPVNYGQYRLGEHVLDLVVEDKVYVELKCKDLSKLETAQVISGLKASRLPLGLLINFKVTRLKNGIRRVILPASNLNSTQQ